MQTDLDPLDLALIGAMRSMDAVQFENLVWRVEFSAGGFDQVQRLPQIPVGRLGKPDEVAGLIIYLCSEEAAFVNGANIAINGGQHMQ